MSDISPREPWPGYADLDEAARDELLAKKFAAGEGPERPGLRRRAGRGGRELRARARAAARTTTSAEPLAATAARPARRRRLVAVELAAIPDARRSKETGNDYGVAEAHLGDAPLPGRPSTCAGRGTRSPTRARPRRASAGRSPTPSCAGTSSRSGRLEPDAAALRPPRLDVGQGDRPARRVPVDVPGEGRDEPEGRASTSCASSASRSSPSFPGRARSRPSPPDDVQPLRAPAPDHGLLQPRRRHRGRPRRAPPEWRKWLHQSGPVLVLIAQDRHFLNDDRASCTTFDDAPRQRQPRRRARRLRPRPLPPALELGHRLGRSRATRG